MSHSQLNQYFRDLAARLLGSPANSDGQLSFSPPKPEIYEGLAASADPAALFLVGERTDDDGALIFSISDTLPPKSYALAVAVMKPGGVLDLEDKLADQLFPMTLPKDTNSTPAQVLRSVIGLVIEPYFESSYQGQPSSNGPTGSGPGPTTNVVATRQKFAELQVSLEKLANTVAIVVPEFDVDRRLLDTAAASDSPDSAVLNALQRAVISWKQAISKIVRTAKEPQAASVDEEILLWAAMEDALQKVQTRLESQDVKDTIAALERGKRFHATIGFPDDTGLQEATELVLGYQTLLRDLPISDLITASDISGVFTALDAIFLHFSKRLRPSGYPVWRAIILVEFISSRVATVLRRLLKRSGLMELGLEEFNAHINEVEGVFVRWNDLVREFTDLARDTIRKRGEKFIPVRITSKHSDLEDRLRYILEFRMRFSKLHEALDSVVSTDAELKVQSPLQAVDMAYGQLSQIDILDTTPGGDATWNTVEKLYTRATSEAEMLISHTLRRRLEQARSSAEMFRVLEKFNTLFDRPAIRAAVQDYQARLLEAVKQDIRDLQTRAKENYFKSSNFETASAVGFPPIASAVVWMRQLEGRLNTYLGRIEKVLGPDWRDYADGKQLYMESEQFRSKLDNKPMVASWIEQTTKKLPTFSEQVLYFGKGRFRASFGIARLDIFREISALIELKVHVPHQLVATASDAQAIFPYGVNIVDALDTFYENDARIQELPDYVILVQRDINAFYQLVSEDGKMLWRDFAGMNDRTVNFRNLLMSIASNFQVRVVKLLETHSEIDALLHSISSGTYNRTDFQEAIKAVQLQIDGLGVGYSNMGVFVRRINSQIVARLTSRCAAEIDKWSTRLNDPKSEEVSVHTLTLKDQTIVAAPPLETSRQTFTDELAVIVAQIQVRLLGHTGTVSLSSNLLDKVAEAMAHVDALVAQSLEYAQRWSSFQGLWDLKHDDVTGQLKLDLGMWNQILDAVYRERRTFESDEKLRRFGRIVAGFSSIHSYVTARYDSWQDFLVQQLGLTAQSVSLDLLQTMSSYKTTLEAMSFSSLDTEVVVANITSLESLKAALPKWSASLDEITGSQARLTKHRHKFDQNWIYAELLRGEYQSVVSIYSRRQTEFEVAKDNILEDIKQQDQQLQKQIGVLSDQWRTSKPLSGSVKPADALFALEKFDDSVKTLLKRNSLMNTAGSVLGFEIPLSVDLEEIGREIVDFTSVWRTVDHIWGSLSALESQSIKSVSGREVKAGLSALNQEMKQVPARTRQYVAFQHVQHELKMRMDTLGLLSTILAASMERRHWEGLYTRIMGVDRTSELSLESLTLGDLWKLDLVANKGFVEEQLEVAQGEQRISEFIQKTQNFWESFVLELVPYKDKVRLISNWSDIFENADEGLQSLSAVRHSPHSKTFERSVTDWETKLHMVRTLFDDWVSVQRQWTHLERVFDVPSIRQVLPMESAKFVSVNSELVAILRLVAKNPHILEVANIPSVGESIKRLGDLLTGLQKSLGEYYESERRRFPRFHYVGDDDLLEILGSTSMTSLQRHVRKMFAGVAGFVAPEGDAKSGKKFAIGGVRSPEDEVLLFGEVLAADEIVQFLLLMEKEVKTALHRELKAAVASFPGAWSDASSFKLWLTRPSQVTLLATRIHWTQILVAASSGSKPNQPSSEVGAYTNILNQLSLDIVGDTSALERKVIEAAMTELVYQKDHLEAFDGSKLHLDRLLKYFWDEKSEELHVKQADAEFSYGFEYLGVPTSLVRTPLIDDLYLTMTRALSEPLGGSPFGPAGTGKTEGVKSLGHALGKSVAVFNCDESFDYPAISRILSGVCQIGAWACFDEFNRLESNILSSMAMQVSAIQTGLRKKSPVIKILDRSTTLNPQTALFVTMNPGYAGRNELPSNMRELFRSFSMAVPDKDQIAEIILYSQGFTNARDLAGSVVQLFAALAQNLSAQKHYDWGLRALKSVLRVLGSIRRKSGDDLDPQQLSGLLKLACRQTIAPKLVQQDLDKYYELETAILPAGAEVAFGDQDLETRVREASLAGNFHFTLNSKWLQKVVELDRFLAVHHGIMLVGAASSGKTAAYKALQAASTRETDTYWIDAKVLSKDAIYGVLDSTTREWKDGIFTQILRRINEDLRGESRKDHWIVFDGDIDPDWAENLNSVLDDNRVLTLPSGERLLLPDNVRILFEVSDLEAATPATITRCGMIYFADVVDSSMLVSNLTARLRDSIVEESDPNKLAGFEIVQRFIASLDLDLVVEKALELRHIMEPHSVRFFETFFSLAHASLDRVVDTTNDFLLRSLYTSLVTAFAGDVEHGEASEFASWIAAQPYEFHHVLSPGISLIGVDVSPISGNWIAWAEKTPRTELDPREVAEADLIIPTEDTVKHEALCQQLMSARQPVILCGPPGSGKSMTLLRVLRGLAGMDMVGLNFSKSATPELVIKALEQRCSYVRTPDGSTALEPTEIGRWLVLFCDEINLPGLDKYGSQPVISLLRGMVEQGGFWKGSTWVALRRIQLVGACNPPTDVGRVALPPRFLNHCAVMYVGYPGPRALHHIYERMCDGLLKTAPDLRGNADALTSSMLEVYHESQAKFSHRSGQFVYSPRELTRWCRGILEVVKHKLSLELPELLRIWAHEAYRLFSDRLSLSEERDWTASVINAAAKRHFPIAGLESALALPILITPWLSKSFADAQLPQLKTFLEARLRVFSEEVTEISLTLFDDLVEHVLRIDRVLRQPQGHLILMGASSSGKTTLTRFVCWMNDIEVVQLRTSARYGDADFAADLRTVLKKAGAHGTKLCFILDESNIQESSFIERMNALLANSEVPGLFENEELATLLSTCKVESAKQGLSLSDDDALMRWFTGEITRNLHVVFTFSSAQTTVAGKALKSPALYNRCVLNWMGDWSAKTLHQFVADQTRTVDIGTTSRETLGDLFTQYHASASSKGGKQLVITPGEYQSFVGQFKRIYIDKKTALEDEQRHFHGGITKLKATVLHVNQLRQKMSEQSEQLQGKDAEAKSMLKQMLSDQSEAERKRAEVITIGAAISKQKADLAARRDVVNADLKLAEPAVIEAQRGVNDIKKQHLNELRAFVNPPDAVKITLEAVCVLLGQPHGSWREVLQSVRSEDFIPSIVHFDNERQMTPQVIRVIQGKYMKLPNFNYESVNRASKASGPLFQWVSAQFQYATILKRVAPLKEELAVLEHEALEKEANAIAIGAMLEELEQKIGKYQEDYAALIAQSETIKMDIVRTQTKLDSSVELTGRLEGERARWGESIASYKQKASVLVGDSILCAALLSYGGFFDYKQRKELLKIWTQALGDEGVASTSGLDIAKSLSTGEERVAWRGYGVPTDNLSVENQVMLKRYDRFPFVIDPTGQAKKFLLGEHGGQLVVTSFRDSSFTKHLESALRFGTSVLIEDAEYTDSIILPLLNREYSKRGGRTLVQFGNSEVDVSKTHKIYLLSRDSQVLIPPHISSRTTVINFSVTRGSLESIALDLTLEVLRPELEAKRQELVKAQDVYRVRLHTLEEQLLSALGSAPEDILEDASLMATLSTLKLESTTIATKVQESEGSLELLERAVVEFEPVAAHSGRLFDLVDNLRQLQGAYLFSLDFFLVVFRATVVPGVPVDELVRRLNVAVYESVSPGLKQEHRVGLLASLLALGGVDVTKMGPDQLEESLVAQASSTLGLTAPFSFAITDDDWSRLIDGSTSSRPLLLNSEGIDVTSRIAAITASHQRVLKVVALGSLEAQDEVVNALNIAAKTGEWVLVQNIDLAPWWMGPLQVQVEKLAAAQPDTRIFFTCSANTTTVPATLRSLCRPISAERPRGLKACLQENLAIVGTRLDNQPVERSRLYLAACWVYSVAQERLQSVPEGWSKAYTFADADLESAGVAVDNHLAVHGSRSNVDPRLIDFATLRYLLFKTVFGCKLDVDRDVRSMKALVDSAFDANIFEAAHELAPGLPGPESAGAAAVREWVAALPQADVPQWLGLAAQPRESDARAHDRLLRGVLATVHSLVQS